MNHHYQTPQAELDQTPSPEKLYKISGIGVATFFGSLIAGGYLLSVNLNRLGNHELGRKTLRISILVTVILLAMAFLLPDNLDGIGLPITIAQIFAITAIAKKYVGQALEQHAANQGQLESNWKAFFISLLVLALLLIAIFAVAFIFFFLFADHF